MYLYIQRENSTGKMSDIANSVTEQIVQKCQCHYVSSFIVDGQLLCDAAKNELSYQAQFLKTDRITSEKVRNLTQEWVLSRPLISLNGAHYQVDPSCSVVVETLGSISCDALFLPTTGSPEPDSATYTPYAPSPFELASIIGVGVIIVLLTIVVICLVTFFVVRRRSRNYKLKIRYTCIIHNNY